MESKQNRDYRDTVVFRDEKNETERIIGSCYRCKVVRTILYLQHRKNRKRRSHFVVFLDKMRAWVSMLDSDNN
jgi:hypothetical protein